MALSPNALSSASLLVFMDKSLPEPSEDQTQLLKDAYSSIALLCHSCMLAVGFNLKGLGEDHKIGMSPIVNCDPGSNSTLEARSDSEDVQPLPTEWNASSTYAFRYSHPQSSMEYLLKINRLGAKALVFGVGLGDDKTASFEVKAQDYISEGSLKDESISSDKPTALKSIFISSGRIADLASLMRSSIIQKLAPGIQKAGYEDSQIDQEQPRRHEETRPPERDPLRDGHPQPARPYPFNDPLAAAPRRPPPGEFPPPDFEDEFEMNRPPRGMPGGYQPFGNIGEQDLYPPGLGPHDPLRIGPGGGGGFRGGGGMHPTFDDPLFGGQGGRGQYDPRAPPGARYDPVGPGDGPPNFRGGLRFPGGGFSGGGVGGNPFGGFGRGDFI